MRIVNLVKCHFDRRSEKATQQWLNDRYSFFYEWTLASLKAQTFKDFRLWFHCDPGMEDMVTGLRVIAPPGSIFTFRPYGEHCIPNMVEGDRKRLLECDYVYVTRIDSDDLFASTAMALVDDLRPQQPGRVEAAIFRRGYMHDVRNGRLGVYHNQSSPFHTLMFPRDVFCDERRYCEAFVGDHSMIDRTYPCQGLPDWQFTVLIHDGNFLSTFDYGRQREEPVEKGWTPQRFISQPVVFDVDDYCDEWDCLDELCRLKDVYPDFRATLFAIPGKCSPALLARTKRHDWLELAVHGVNHVRDELLHTPMRELRDFLRSLDYTVWAEGFRPPFWQTPSSVIDACNDAGLWVALHDRDKRTLGPHCRHGFYSCGERLPASHHHAHDTCGNWLKKDLPRLLTQWPHTQTFSWVSDSVLVPQR